MTRKLMALAVVGLLCGTAAVTADDKKPEPTKPDAKGKLGKLDKAKLFEKLDADGDGKVTKEEFKKFADQIKDRLKGKGKGDKLPELFGEKMFEKMDKDGDGKVTKEEFEKFEPEQLRKRKKDKDGE
jgi:hypothetical protein